jgi:periplasmic mercuric ion binding protein
MKKIHFTLFLIFSLVLTSVAQRKVSDKAVIKTPTVHCEDCKDRIERFLSHQYGITSVKVDVKKKTTTVTWLTDRSDIETIKTAIANAGYDADDVAADGTAYKKLPPKCKKPVEIKPVEN